LTLAYWDEISKMVGAGNNLDGEECREEVQGRHGGT
jgi:hypothetical protein